jgi:DNA-binding response OmpR family regulator
MSALTVTFTVPLAEEQLSPQASRLLEVVRELAQQGEITPRTIQQSEPLRILSGSRAVVRGTQQLELTRLEFDLLHFLAENPRRVFSRRQLLGAVWGYEHAVARTVDVHVRRLRAKLGEDTPVVTTVYGVGYRLADDARITVEE